MKSFYYYIYYILKVINKFNKKEEEPKKEPVPVIDEKTELLKEIRDYLVNQDKKEVSAMYVNKVEICGVDTSKLPLMKEAEKTKLLKETKNGNKLAREKLINGNLRLVLSVIQKFSNRGENLDDLFQVGCIGLIKAIDNFDLSHGVKFSTYAVPMIIGEIRRYLRDNNMVRVSRSVRDLAYRVLQAKEKIIRENGKEPTCNTAS